jgi:hypothetical protein
MTSKVQWSTLVEIEAEVREKVPDDPSKIGDMAPKTFFAGDLRA